MRSRLHTPVLVVLVVLVAFLVVTNPVVSEASGQITGAVVKNGSLTGKDVKNGSLRSADFGAGQVPAGPAGPAGKPGTDGRPGSDGVLATGWVSYRYDRDTGYAPRTMPGNQSYGDVVTLGAGPGQRSGAVSVSEPARLVVSASGYLANGNSLGRSQGCYLELRPAGGTPRPITFASQDSVPALSNITWSQSGSIGVGAGTYDVALRCRTGLDNTGGAVYFVDLTVLAVRSSS